MRSFEEEKKVGSLKFPRSGLAYYGQVLGILMMDQSSSRPGFTRIPGDVGNATTFNFPVQYKVMWGISNKEIVNRNPSKDTENKVIEYAKELEKEGVRAIGTYCGFMSYFQKSVVSFS